MRLTLLVLHFLDVRTSFPTALQTMNASSETSALTSKGPVATGEDEGTNAVVRVELLERGIELVEKWCAERIERLGAVEGEEADALGGARGEDEFVLGGRHEAE